MFHQAIWKTIMLAALLSPTAMAARSCAYYTTRSGAEIAFCAGEAADQKDDQIYHRPKAGAGDWILLRRGIQLS